jgi:hypothetical protein
MSRDRSVFRYYADERWAREFLRGNFRFWSLAYFRDLEDKGIRGDPNEGRAVHAPAAGLEITNQTRGTKHTVTAFTSTVRYDEIFVFCLSRAFSADLWDEFAAVVCIEVVDVPQFCSRVVAGLPGDASFPGAPGRERVGRRVDYYNASEAAGTRYALPDQIACSKLAGYRRQDEFRLVFSRTDALKFQKVDMKLVLQGSLPDPPRITDHAYFDATIGAIDDLCRVYSTKPPRRVV